VLIVSLRCARLIGCVAATKYRRKVSEKSSEGEEVWVSPIMDAGRGRLRTNAGRMGRTAGGDNEKYGPDPYENV
jgi:hypothetical protein